MRADRADFLARRRGHALADDGRQAPVEVDAEVAAERHGVRAEVVRIDERAQRQYLVALRFAERFDRRAVGHDHRSLADHLCQPRIFAQAPAGR